MPLTLSLACFYVTFLSITRDSINRLLISIGGVFLGLAIGIKLTFITLIIPFLLLSYFYPITRKHPNEKTNAVTFFIIGLIVSLLPIMYFLFLILIFFILII